jgi:hypothetical protein
LVLHRRWVTREKPVRCINRGAATHKIDHIGQIGCNRA